ncbi:hypothetical protein H105_00066 [Trichophyton soudanense CBS 452.61]|uniref:Invertebrate defensins family profile domain-containing protein n=1 Tax=Trichophyton soudanense CBS 452.61 TaxID=1215331 RepID=A0A022Y7Z9_TRISD|nr:hypothetical protein H105_00066 [Trichophyton soudanense CBS 452.61]
MKISSLCALAMTFLVSGTAIAGCVEAQCDASCCREGYTGGTCLKNAGFSYCACRGARPPGRRR